MKTTLALLITLLRASHPAVLAADDWVTCPQVPGLAESAHYRGRVCPAKQAGTWRGAFARQTACNRVEKDSETYFAYFAHHAGWTHTYVNFETAGPVAVEISRTNDEPIRTAAVHPERKTPVCMVQDGKVFAELESPCLVAVEYYVASGSAEIKGPDPKCTGSTLPFTTIPPSAKDPVKLIVAGYRKNRLKEPLVQTASQIVRQFHITRTSS